MKHIYSPLSFIRSAALLASALLLSGSVHAQRTKYWVGGSGTWSDAFNWSDQAGGAGGAGVPRANDAAVLVVDAAVEVLVDADATCASLLIDASHGSLRLSGAADHRIEVGGDVRTYGQVDWRFAGTLELVADEGSVVLDTRGVRMAGDVLLNGDAQWDLLGALNLADGASLVLKRGTLRTNDKAMILGGLRAEGRANKRLEAGGSIILAQRYAPEGLESRVDPGSSTLLVQGLPVRWDGSPIDIDAFMRGITNCATGAGQIPFVVNAFATSNYNGFGVSCTGACDGAVSVTITGGTGNFSRQWAPAGPTTANWAPVCAGGKLVTVIDLGQGVGCFASVQVTAPLPLGVIFFGLNPPTCADVCNGTAITFPGGGTESGYVYDWNNGVENTSNPSQLCAGINSLELEDSNGCIFDTTFTIDLLPLLADLTFTDALCAGDCDGTAEVAVSGGTPQYSYNWEPGSPNGDGTGTVTGLCPGNWTVAVADANGCDTLISFSIAAPPPLVPNLTFLDAACFGACDGSASVAPTGGSGNFLFDWEPGAIAGDGTPDATGLCAGAYSVLITDQDNGCDTLVSFIIGSAPAIDLQLTITDAGCNDECDGAADVVISGGTPGYVILWTPGIIVGQGTPNASQLCAGDYAVTITDAAGCDTTLQFTIAEPDPIDPNITVTNVSCFGACDGTITCAPTGGTPGFSFSWTPTPPAGDGTSTVSGLCAGDWTVSITDAAGCDTTITVTITEPPPLAVQPAQTNISCGTDCDGTATVLVSGGSPDYTYDWSGSPVGDGTPTVTGLCAGTYSVQVLDSALCEVIQSFTIEPPQPLVVAITTVNATCPDFCNGSATALVSGGNDPYTYLWAPPPGNGQGTATATGLCAQDYTLTITDSVGCDTTILFTITAPLPIDPNASVTNNTCSGSCDGSIILAPTGGFGTFTYTWTPTPPNGPGTEQALNLCAGTWQVVVASGVCDTTLIFEITEPLPIDAGLTTTPVTCGGDCDGSATSSTSGGTAGYTWTWDPAPTSGQGTQVATGFCAGPHTLTIVDAAGCDTVIAFTIDAPEPIVPLLTTTLASCGGDCDGSATVSSTGGTGPITIVWAPEPGGGQGTNTATDLCPGVWQVTLTDSVGCDTTLQFIINTPSGILAVPTITDASCGDLCDGAIDLDISGGVPGYQIGWSPTPPVGGGTSISGLCAGEWTATITDQAGCDTVLVIVIDGPEPILPNGTFTNETCNGPCDGTATVNPTGGSGSYTFLWAPTPPIGDGTASVAGLCAGDWCVTITDVAGCDTTWCFTVLPQQSVSGVLSITDATCPLTCNGFASVVASGGVPDYTYDWQPTPAVGQGTADVSGLCLGQYVLTVTDAVGCDTTFTFDIGKPPPITTSLAFTAADCVDSCSGEAAAFPSGGNGGFTFLWQPDPGSGQGSFFVDGLCAGVTYSLLITDSLGCDTTETFTIPEFTPIDPGFSTTPTSCADVCDGTATLGVTGGEAPYTYDWSPDPISGDGTNTVTGLCAGAYEVLITDDNGCDTLVNVLITSPDPIVITPLVQGIRCNGECNGSIVLNSFGGSGSFTYVWSPQPGQGQGTAFASQLCAGTWSVLVTDATGCDTTLTFTLVDPPVFSIGVDVVQSDCQSCIGGIFLDPDGAGPYTFNWGPPIGQSTPDSIQLGLCAGLYPVIGIDAFGCAIQLDIPVNDSDGEVITTTDGSVTCPTDCDGVVSVSYNCSAAPCMVEWFDPSGFPLFLTSDTITGLCAGVYFAQVMNANGCITIDTAEVFAPEPMEVQFGTTPVSCAGSCDGTAGFGIIGGVPPYTIVWDPAPPVGQGTNTVSGLCAGTYAVDITDALGCSITANVLILAPLPLIPDAAVQEISCAGACDGQVDLDVTGGTGAITYFWDPVPPNGQGTDLATDLCPGSWSVTITDANGCDTVRTFVLQDPPALVLTPSATPSNCQVCDGTASVQIAGGTGNVVVTWTDQAANLIGNGTALTGLCAGIYTATAVDDRGCATSAIAVVSDAAGETLTITDGQTTCANNCDGSVAVSFVCSTGPCEITWYDAGAQPIAFNVFALNDLCVGTYLVQVDNGAGCTVIDTAIVAPSQLLIPNLSTTPVSCNGLCDGTATVGPQGGVLPYVFDWSPDPVAGDGTPSVTGLCAGVYSVSITDDSGCDTTVNVLILEPAPLTVAAQIQDNTCEGACDGSISLLVAGGTGSISYTWDPVPLNGQGTPVVTGLCAGDHTVIITDSLGCDTSITYTITEPDALTLSTTSTQSTCGVCSGTTNAVAAGGSAPYTYSWTSGGVLVGTDSALVNVCAGIYLVTVTDANGCQLQQAVPVTDADGELVTTTGDVVTCPGSCDGEVSASFVCGTTPCTITWSDVLGNDLGETGNALDSLCPGSYFVQVLNGNGCLTIDTAIVQEPQPILPNLGTTPASCADVCDGTATVGPTGGVAPYTYDWGPDPITGDSTSTVTGLCGAIYSVSITDSVGCNVVLDVLIPAPPALTATAVIDPISCNGACDGAITLTTSGGTGQPAFTWVPEPPSGVGAATITELCPDTWTVTINDVNGCDTVYSFTLVDPPVLQVDLQTTDIGCFGDCSGAASTFVSGGSGTYQIIWTTAGGVLIAQGVDTISDLCAGDYLLNVTDGAGCTSSTPFTIEQAPALTAQVVFSGETCNGPCDGTAVITPGGGSGPLFITWTDPDGVVFAQDTNQVSGLCAGNWSVTVADSAGCDSTFNFTLLPYTPINVAPVITQVLCNGACDGTIILNTAGGIGALQHVWLPVPPIGDGTAAIAGLCPDDWTVVITDAADCDTSFTYTITEPAAITISVDAVVEASCNTAPDGSIQTTIGGGTPVLTIGWTGPDNYTSDEEDPSGLLPGAYTLVVEDANGCTDQTVVSVGALSTVVADAGEDQNICAGGSILLDGSASAGALTYTWNDAQGSLLGTSAEVTLDALSPGAYTFILTVADGPCSDQDTVSITVLELPLANAGLDQDIFIQGSAVLGGQPSGPLGSTFSWFPDSLVNDPALANPTTSPEATTWYVLTVTSLNGCVDTDSVLVTVVPDIVIPSGFTPTGDGANDVWQIDHIDLFTECTVEIYNRWGELLFSSKGYTVPWDGTYNGEPVPVGTYYYAIELNDERFPEPYTGPLTVIR